MGEDIQFAEIEANRKAMLQRDYERSMKSKSPKALYHQAAALLKQERGDHKKKKRDEKEAIAQAQEELLAKFDKFDLKSEERQEAQQLRQEQRQAYLDARPSKQTSDFRPKSDFKSNAQAGEKPRKLLTQYELRTKQRAHNSRTTAPAAQNEFGEGSRLRKFWY